ncbi:MAG: hypothetical protein H6977_10810 [Gammaproteobacteria bacterium]|nr:hypothetical protein [Gammaproteobacteria bacterium]MCP5200493.1 hypothetical protein [Gammaproteobacteria bacterium]
MHRHLAWIALAVLVSACSTDGWNRFLYGLGDQYACTEHNNGRIDRTGRDADCLNPAGAGRTRYEDYRDARATAGAKP